MVELIFGIFFLLIVGAIYFLVVNWLPILIGIIAVIVISIVIYSLWFKATKKKLDRVVRAYIISREPIKKREKEILGYERKVICLLAQNLSHLF